MQLKVAYIYAYKSYFNVLRAISNALPEAQNDFYFYEYSSAENIENHKTIASFADFVVKESLGYDAIFLGVGGGDLLRCFKEIAVHYNNNPSRPVFLTLFPGIRNLGDEKGLLVRIPSDLTLLGTYEDGKEYDCATKFLGVEASNLVIGFPQLHGKQQKAVTNKNNNIVFYQQSGMPEKRQDYEKILQGIAKFAANNKESKVYFIEKPKESDTHVSLDLNSDLTNKLAEYDNIIRAYDDDGLEFSRCFTVSSTKIIEPIYQNIPSAIIADFGIKRRLGNLFFRNSGIFLPLNKIFDLNYKLHLPNNDWLNNNIISFDSKTELFRTELFKLIGKQNKSRDFMSVIAKIDKELVLLRRSKKIGKSMLIKKYRSLKWKLLEK